MMMIGGNLAESNRILSASIPDLKSGAKDHPSRRSPQEIDFLKGFLSNENYFPHEPQVLEVQGPQDPLTLPIKRLSPYNLRQQAVQT